MRPRLSVTRTRGAGGAPENSRTPSFSKTRRNCNLDKFQRIKTNKRKIKGREKSHGLAREETNFRGLGDARLYLRGERTRKLERASPFTQRVVHPIASYYVREGKAPELSFRSYSEHGEQTPCSMKRTCQGTGTHRFIDGTLAHSSILENFIVTLVLVMFGSNSKTGFPSIYIGLHFLTAAYRCHLPYIYLNLDL